LGVECVDSGVVTSWHTWVCVMAHMGMCCGTRMGMRCGTHKHIHRVEGVWIMGVKSHGASCYDVAIPSLPRCVLVDTATHSGGVKELEGNIG